MSTRNPATPRSSQNAMMSRSACTVAPWPGASTDCRHGSSSGRRRVAEVQRRLLVVEVLQVVAGPGSWRRAPRPPPRVRPGSRCVGPPGPTRHSGHRPGAARRRAARPGTRVLDRGVPSDQVQQHPDPARPGRVDERDQVVVGAVARGDLQVVGDVVAGIDERRGEARVEPDRVDAEPLQVVEAGRAPRGGRRCRRRRSRRTTAGRSRRDSVGQPVRRLRGPGAHRAQARGVHRAPSNRTPG